MKESFYVLIFFAFVLAWGKFLERLGDKLGLSLVFVIKKMKELENFLFPIVDIPKEVLLRDGDLCPCCEKEQVKERDLVHTVLTAGDSRCSLKYLWCLACQKSFPRR